MADTSLQSDFRLGDCLIQPLQCQIVTPDGAQHVQPKVMDVLLCLVAHRQNVVERETILKEVWNRLAVSDEVLTRCISELRQALGDRRHPPAYIQTIPKRGYRLIARVDEVPATEMPERIKLVEHGSGQPHVQVSSRGFLDEMKRRKIIRVAAVYSIVAWLILQIAETTFPALLVPPWGLTLMVLVLLFGFPIALVLAWANDAGPLPLPVDGKTVLSQHRYTDFALLFGMAMIVSYLALRLIDAHFPTTEQRPRQSSNNSIAVLPFTNMSGDPGKDYFSDGISEELINSLVKIPTLRVPARTSSFSFRGKGMDIPAIADRLGVTNIVQGSVRWAGERLRITAQLVDATGGHNLWTQTYDRELTDIFKIQQEIAEDVVRALKVELATSQSLKPSVTTNDPEAYRHYLKGKYHWQRRDHNSLRRSIESFEAAIQLDSTFAQAYSALASALSLIATFESDQRPLLLAEAIEKAEMALEIDDSHASALAVLADIDAHEWKWIDAESKFLQAIEADPTDVLAHHWYSSFLGVVGRREESIQHARKAYDLDPVSPAVAHLLAWAYLAAGRTQEALQHLAAAKDLGFPETLGTAYITFVTHVRKEDYGRAKQQLEETLLQQGLDTSWLPSYVGALEDRAMVEAASDALRTAYASDVIPAKMLLYFAILLPDGDLVFEVLGYLREQTVSPGRMLWFAEAQPLRKDSRFINFLDGAGFLKYWERHGWPTECRPLAATIQCN